MSVVISDAMTLVEATGVPLTHARIGWHTILRDAVLTASSAAPGFPVSSLANSMTYDRWLPVALPATVTIDAGAAVAADYLGIAAHLLRDGLNTVTLSYLDAGAWTEIAAGQPEDNGTLLFLFPEVVSRWWRLTFAGATPQPVGVVYLGRALAMQRPIYQGHTPLTLSADTVIRPQRSERGQFLGRTIIRGGFKTGAAWSNLSAAWVRDSFMPFVKSARRYPFFFAWRPGSFPKEVGYVWTPGDIAPSNAGPRDLMSVDMEIEGLGDE